jgi:hypothetical protein
MAAISRKSSIKSLIKSAEDWMVLKKPICSSFKAPTASSTREVYPA